MWKKILVVTLWVASAAVWAQEETNYYVVVGAFRNLNYAIRYTDEANKAGFNAEYALHPARQLYYVFLLATPEKRRAYAFMMKMRVETKYKEAWVYAGSLGAGVVAESPQEPVVDDQPEKMPSDGVVVEPVKKDSIVAAVEPLIVEKPPVVEEKKPFYRTFVFQLIDADDNSPVKGEVFLQEDPRAEEFVAYVANEGTQVTPPRNTAGTYSLVTQAAGYRMVMQNLNYKPLMSDGGDADKPIVVPIRLVKVKKGDYVEFSHVRFFKDAAILQPGSRDELLGLADLMKENTRYKIKVHAHCNGKADREATLLGASTEYFALTDQNVKKKVSAKELTAARAQLIKDFFVSQGIDGSRVGTVAEGGRVPLYPETGKTAPFNDRIEIEVVRK
ncbi:MAG: OmpA family protein [Cyclobacteriaceae bacterium]|jgi:outer membrane protein OmpA-like peptidoglycan-associated protein|nr:OmpA family protein [Cyclobacteriaceae bacterium]